MGSVWLKYAKSPIVLSNLNLLSNPNIGNVEVFGGYESGINIEVDPYKAKRYGVNFDLIAKAIQSLNRDMPIGFVKGDNSFYTVTYYGEKDEIGKIKQIPVLPNVMLGEVADVNWGYKKRMSGYEGNGKAAIALAIQRSARWKRTGREHGSTD